MAIAFNLPSEREAAEEDYARLHRLLGELYDVLCNMLVASRRAAQRAHYSCGGSCPHASGSSAGNVPATPTYVVSLVMVVAILKVYLVSSITNIPR